MAWSRVGLRAWAALLVASAGLLAAPGSLVADDEPGGGGEGEAPARLDPFFRAIDPSKVQRGLDRLFGLDPDGPSGRTRGPEIPEPIFFDLVRPLGDLKYSNELNYLYNASTRNAPALQVIEYEYVFGDWRSAELDLSYYDGSLQILTPFYQRTLGVGRRRNWVHGYQLSLDIYQRSGFVGGSPAYIFSWKPEEESRFATTLFVGANRALINGFDTSVRGPDRPYGAWRPLFIADFFYRLNEKFAIGIENDLFFQAGKSSEYLSFPFVNYKAGEHALIQAGAGYYHFESRDQFTAFVHVNLLNPTNRKPREPEAPDREPEAEEPRRGGPIRRCLGRLLDGG